MKLQVENVLISENNIGSLDVETMKKILAVILTYNRKEMLCRCIDAVISQRGAKCDILVADGNSPDGTGNLFGVKGRYPDVIYFNLGKNMGSAGFSHAIEKAVRLGYEYLWLLDDDVIPDETALAQLLKADRYLAGEWGYLLSYAYWKDGTACKANIPKTGLFSFVPVDTTHKLIPVKMGSWASLLIKTDIVYEVGLPIKDYYISTEDYEYTARISRKYPAYQVMSSRVLHAKKANIKTDLLSESDTRLYRFNYLYRNDVHFYRQYGLRGWMYLFFKFFYNFFRILLFEKKYKRWKTGVLIKGYLKGFSFHPETEYISRP